MCYLFKMESAKLVKKVISICESVPNYIDPSLCYSEYCYQNLIKQLLHKEGIFCEIEAPVYFRTKCNLNFGWGKIDILIRGKTQIIIIELKANVRSYIKAEKQLQRYLVHFESTLPKVGLLFLYNSMDRHPIIKKVLV